MKADLTKVQRTLNDNPDLICLIGMMLRPGVSLFFTMIEWRYFRPSTRRNRDFEMLVFHVNEVPFAACIVRRSMIPPGALEATLAEAKLRMDNQQRMFVLGGPEGGAFPLFGENVYHLTFVSGHPAYGKHDADALAKEEKVQMDAEARKPELTDLPEPTCLPTGRRYTSVEELVRGEGITVDLQGS